MSSPTARARTSLCDSRRSTVCAEMRPLSYLGATSYCALTDRDAQWANKLACSVPSSASSASHRSLSDFGRRAFQRIWRSVIDPDGALSYRSAGGLGDGNLLSETSRPDFRPVRKKE